MARPGVHHPAHRPAAGEKGHRLHPQAVSRSMPPPTAYAGRMAPPWTTTTWSSPPAQAELRRSARLPAPRRPHPFGVHGGPCRGLLEGLPGIPEEPRPGGHRRDAVGQLLRPGLRVRLHPGHRPAQAQAAPQGAHHLRHQRALHRPPGPGRRGRQQVDAGVRAAQPRHEVDHQRQDHQGRGRQDVRDPARRPRPSTRSTKCPSRCP
jgi:hypothetical protein